MKQYCGHNVEIPDYIVHLQKLLTAKVYQNLTLTSPELYENLAKTLLKFNRNF